MTLEKIEKVKEKTFNDTLMSGLFAFNSLTYVIIFIVMSPAYTIIPAILALAVMVFFISKFVQNITLFNKVKKYQQKAIKIKEASEK